MSLLECPDCKHRVSNEAEICPFCGFPITLRLNYGNIKLKLEPLRPVFGLSGHQRAEIYDQDGKLLWRGFVGDTAEIFMNGKTNVTIKYFYNFLQFGGHCSVSVTPNRGKKYKIVPRRGFFSANLTLQKVDFFI